MIFYYYNTADELNQDFAIRVSTQLSQAIALRGKAYLVVPGGRTPVSFFEQLSQETLDWLHVTILLTDERCLPETDAERNAVLVQRHLLKHQARFAHFLDFSNHLDALAGVPMFDVVILGMGEDGHIASLFPCSEEIKMGSLETSCSVLRVIPKTAPYPRISLSKKRLLNTRAIYLHIVGEKKKTVFERACDGHDEQEMPVRAFLNADVNVQVMFSP